MNCPHCTGDHTLSQCPTWRAPIQSAELAELRKLAEAATPGPWIAGNDDDSDYFLIGPEIYPGIVTNPVVKLHYERDADYIAAANPAAILRLRAAIASASLAHDRASCCLHDSDCAVHNAPALPVGPCDCTLAQAHAQPASSEPTLQVMCVLKADLLAAQDCTSMEQIDTLANKIAARLLRPSDDELWDATLRDRDTYHEWADKLADAIAAHFGIDIGEHSNQNLPWAEALEHIESATQEQAKPTLDIEQVFALSRQVKPTDLQAVPDGWKLVPVAATEEMHAAAVKTIIRCLGNDDFPPKVYAAMLAAAPTPPAARELTDAEIEVIARQSGTGGWLTLGDMNSFARKIERALSGNTAAKGE